MTKVTSILLFLSLTAVSCSDRYEYFEKVNQPPSLYFVKNNDLTPELTDSIKISRHPYYPIKIQVTDSTSEIASLKFEVARGNGEMFYKNNVLKSNNLNTHNSSISLKWVPADSGVHELAFIATDRFKKSKKATLRLFCFNNLPPVARLNVIPLQKESRFEYLLDASESYDQDQNWGGYIISYRFQINGVTISTTEPSVKYIFPSPGTYSVYLSVKDEQGELSDVKVFKIEVRP